MDELLRPRSFKGSPIGRIALTVGAVSFAVGYVGPILVSDSNLGPLLGIFVTGPLGFLLGALAGILISARRTPGSVARTELKWLAGAWLGALLFTLFASIGSIGWLSLLAQLSVLATAAALFYLMPVRLPEAVERSRGLILVGAMLIVLVSIFPPLNAGDPADPAVAFFLDPRFDASTHIPDFSVSQSRLALAWLIIAAPIVGVVLIAWRGTRA